MVNITSDMLLSYLKSFSRAITLEKLEDLLNVPSATIKRMTKKGCGWWVNAADWEKKNDENIHVMPQFASQVIHAFETCYEDYLFGDLDEAKRRLESVLSEAQIPQNTIQDLMNRSSFEEMIKKLVLLTESTYLGIRLGPNSGVELVTFEKLTEEGWNHFDVALNLVQNDRVLYPQISDKNEGDPQLWSGFIQTYPECWRFLFDHRSKRIVGNWSILSITDEQRECMLKGELYEADMSLSNISHIFVPGIHDLYILNFSCNEGYHTSKNMHLLFDAFVHQLHEFAKNKVYFRDIFVNVFAPEHEAFFSELGFRWRVDNKSTGKIFALPMQPFPDVFIDNEELYELYQRRFEKTKV